MDQLDDELLQLADGGTIRYSDLARKTGEPLSTVHMRMKKLEREGFIRHYRGDIDWKRAGFPITAYIFITIDVDLLKKIRKSQDDLLRELLGVVYVRDGSLITGDADILVKIIARSSDHLKELLMDHIDSKAGVVRTRTMLVLG